MVEHRLAYATGCLLATAHMVGQAVITGNRMLFLVVVLCFVCKSRICSQLALSPLLTLTAGRRPLVGGQSSNLLKLPHTVSIMRSRSLCYVDESNLHSARSVWGLRSSAVAPRHSQINRSSAHSAANCVVKHWSTRCVTRESNHRWWEDFQKRFGECFQHAKNERVRPVKGPMKVKRVWSTVWKKF